MYSLFTDWWYCFWNFKSKKQSRSIFLWGTLTPWFHLFLFFFNIFLGLLLYNLSLFTAFALMENFKYMFSVVVVESFKRFFHWWTRSSSYIYTVDVNPADVWDNTTVRFANYWHVLVGTSSSGLWDGRDRVSEWRCSVAFSHRNCNLALSSLTNKKEMGNEKIGRAAGNEEQHVVRNTRDYGVGGQSFFSFASPPAMALSPPTFTSGQPYLMLLNFPLPWEDTEQRCVLYSCPPLSPNVH